MEVHAPVRRELQDIGAQDLPEGGDYDEFRLPCADRLRGSRLAQALGLENIQTQFDRGQLDRRGDQLTAPAGRPVGLCDDSHNLVGRGQPTQRRHGEIRGSHEHDAHGAILAWRNGS
jgi:hypothetical protein